jgi:hypothetical protein
MEGSIMDVILNILRAWIMIFALILFLISITAYSRTKHNRLLFVSIAFAIFFIKSIVLTLGLLYPDIESLYGSGLGDTLDLLILVSLAATVLKK